MRKTTSVKRFAKLSKYLIFCLLLANKTITINALPNPIGTHTLGNITFLLGLRGGINFSTPQVLTNYSLFSSNSTANGPASKTYGKWYQNLGSQYGLIAMAKLSEKTYVSLQPSISAHNFKYTGLYTWINPKDVSQTTSLTYKHINSLKYFEIPLLVRRDLTNSKLTPYIQGGGFYSMLQAGIQNANLTEVVGSGSLINQIPEGTMSGSVTSQYLNSHLGLIAGGGLAYKFEFDMIGLDLQYKRGLNIITNKANRFNNQSILGDTFDVPDDIKLHAWMISFNIIFNLGLNKPAKSALKCP